MVLSERELRLQALERKYAFDAGPELKPRPLPLKIAYYGSDGAGPFWSQREAGSHYGTSGRAVEQALHRRRRLGAGSGRSRGGVLIHKVEVSRAS